MFSIGTLCKTKATIYVWPITDDFENSFWLARESLIGIVGIEKNYFVIHTSFGVFRTNSFYSFYEPEECFEILAESDE